MFPLCFLTSFFDQQDVCNGKIKTRVTLSRSLIEILSRDVRAKRLHETLKLGAPTVNDSDNTTFKVKCFSPTITINPNIQVEIMATSIQVS